MLEITIALLWFVSAFADYNLYCYLWQLKWYRFDRFKDFLSTRQGKKFLSGYNMFARTLLALAVFFWPINDSETVKYIIVTIFSFDAFHVIYDLKKQKLRRPLFSTKATVIIGLSMLLEGMLLLITRDWTFLILAVILRFFIISGFIVLINLVSHRIMKWTIEQARKKLMRYPNLKVIGITGSYGKTTTKEFVAHILEAKFHVIKTPRNINSDYGIAQFILMTDFSKADVFVVEMGAYSKGDLKDHCYLARPTIGVLTAINEQHMSLMGSLKDIQETKYELLRSLPSNGLAVVNGDNALCREFLHELTCKVRTFGAQEDFNPTYLITDVHKIKGGVESSGRLLCDDGQVVEGTLYVPIPGVHNAMNIAPAIIIADHFGLTKEEIFAQCATISLPETSTQIYHYGNATIVDDTYNSNPKGFRAALDVLASFPSDQKRIVITRGMLELGSASVEQHERIGEEIAFVADELVIITPDSAIPLTKGVGTKYQTDVTTIYDPSDLLKYVQSLKAEHCVILLENRIPSIILSELKPSRKHTTRKFIFTGFVPNATMSDLRTALTYLLLPWKWRSIRIGKKVTQAEQWLKTFFSVPHVSIFDSGRSALYIALKALGVGPGDEVLVQAYTCVVVINAIKWTGAKPVYVDIQDDFNINPEDLRKKITARSKVIIIQHTFGIPADLDTLIDIARENKLLTIEDCAHSLGISYKGKLTGLFADIGMLSFGSDKMIACMRGGALVTNNPAFGAKMEELKNTLGLFPLRMTVQHLISYPVFFIGKRLYHLEVGKWLMATTKQLGITARIIENYEKKGESRPRTFPSQMPNALAKILCGQLERLTSSNEHRKNIAQHYAQLINNPLVTKPEERNSEYLRYPLRTKNPSALRQYAHQHHVILGNWYNVVVAPDDVDLSTTGYKLGSCPHAELLASESINLPVHKDMTEEKAHIISDIINTYKNKN